MFHIFFFKAFDVYYRIRLVYVEAGYTYSRSQHGVKRKGSNIRETLNNSLFSSFLFLPEVSATYTSHMFRLDKKEDGTGWFVKVFPNIWTHPQFPKIHNQAPYCDFVLHYDLKKWQFLRFISIYFSPFSLLSVKMALKFWKMQLNM
jgi:hypothetical protein